MKDISNLALFVVLCFVLLPVFISCRQKLGLGKDILLSSIRAFIQLLILGFLISYIFSFNNPFAIIGYIFLMAIIASLNISQKGQHFQKTFLIVFLSIALSVSIPLILCLLFSIVPFDAQHLIPLGGMFSGAAMVTCAVILEAMAKGMQTEETEMRKSAVKIAMVPTVESLKTMGLVQMPGTMTGMILAGVDPLKAVKYQIFIVFTLLIVSAVSAILLSHFNYRTFYYSRKEKPSARSVNE
ncbi:MAG: ABC transporter permease [Ectobacillus sp.]